MLMKARSRSGIGQRAAAAGLRRRVPARHRPAGGAHGRRLQQDVRRRRARDAADRPGRQPAGAAGRRQAARADRRRGALGLLRRAQGHRRHRAAARDGRPDPGQRVGPAAAQDAVRREVRRPRAAGRGRRSGGCPRATSSRRTARRTAIELERVLDDLLPLLRTIQPAKLNATLDALATALEGRGERLGRQPRAGRRLLHPAQPGAARDQGGHLAGWPTCRGSTPTRPPTWCGCCATSRSPRSTIEAKSDGLRRLPGRHRRRSPTTTRQLLEENDDRIIQLAAVGRPTLELLARYSPEYPCLLAGPGPVQRLHRQDVRERRAAHHPRGHPGPARVRARARSPLGRAPGPDCCGLPSPPRPWPGNHFRDGTHGAGTANSVVPGFLRRPAERSAGGPRRSSASSTPWWRRRWACRPTTCPTSRPCCSGRWPAGRRWGSREDRCPSLIKLIVFIVVTVLRDRPARRHHRQLPLRRHRRRTGRCSPT